MLDLQLIGVHPDEEHLLLMTPDGQRYRLAIDDALRAAVRRDRSALGQIQSTSPGAVRPRDIQAQIRAGHSAEQVAKAAGISVDHVRRYEGPVLAERTHLCSMVLRHRLQGDGPDQGRELGEVVAERLMSRDVRDEPEWDSWRQDDGKWLVQLSFRAGTKNRKAQWTYHASKQKLESVDDEARWFLSGTQVVAEQLAAPIAAVPAAESSSHNAAGGQSAEVATPDTPGDDASSSWASTEALLSHLNAQRGVRPHMGESGEVAVPSAWQEVDLRDDQVLAPPPVHEDDPRIVPVSQQPAEHSPVDQGVASPQHVGQTPATPVHGTQFPATQIPAAQASTTQASPTQLPGQSPDVQSETTDVIHTEDSGTRHLSSVPVVAADDDHDDNDQRDLIVLDDVTSGETDTTVASVDVAQAEASVDVEEEPVSTGKRRSSVPTWDEIMFGSRRKD